MYETVYLFCSVIEILCIRPYIDKQFKMFWRVISLQSILGVIFSSLYFIKILRCRMFKVRRKVSKSSCTLIAIESDLTAINIM